MSYQVVNTVDGDIGVIFPEDPQYESIAKEACNRCAGQTPGNWVVLHIIEIYRMDTRVDKQETS